MNMKQMQQTRQRLLDQAYIGLVDVAEWQAFIDRLKAAGYASNAARLAARLGKILESRA
jgi:hypothetical protein